MTTEQSQPQPKVAIVIVTYNALEFVKICLESVRRYTTMAYELIVVDNCSEPAVRSYLQGLSNVKLILNEENQLWCAGCNQGIGAISCDVTHVMLLNSDMEIRRADWLQRMINVIDSSDRIGIIGTAHDRVRIWPTFGGVDGQCLMFKRHLIDEIGLLDSERLPWNGADIDYAARAFKLGYIYKIMPAQPELAVHYHGMSRRARSTTGDRTNLQRDIDIPAILRHAGLRPRCLPKFIWHLYKRLPGRPFFELTELEKRIARGGGKTGPTRYGQKLQST